MLNTGLEHLESLKDGRRVFIGGEKVTDVTEHPAFRNAARSFAMLYDKKCLPENRDIMSVEEDGDVYSSWFLMPRCAEDLQKRFETHRRIAEWIHGLLGRSPDHVASFVTGLAMKPDMFENIKKRALARILEPITSTCEKTIFLHVIRYCRRRVPESLSYTSGKV